MTRDFDLIRAILLDIEGKSAPSKRVSYHYDHEDREAVAHALDLLAKRGLISAQTFQTFETHPSDMYFAPSLPWEGHDFLDTVRDDEIWRRTKEGAKAAGGFTFELLKQLSTGLVKTQIEKHTGVKLD